MKTFKIAYKDTFQFSKLVEDYLDRDKKIEPFVGRFPSIENFEHQILEKKQQKINRKVLVEVLQDQYQTISISTATTKNINLLNQENTFTITTGHQLCIFTGPLYVIYKIISTINLTENLSKKYPQYNFVPIFWMASEDHDFQEVNHIHLFGKKYQWESNQNGAVGKMALDGMENILKELKIVFGNESHAKELLDIFEQAYLQSADLATATRFLFNHFFGKYGLVILDGNDKRLKQQIEPIIEKDVLQNAYQSLVESNTRKITQYYKAQVPVRNNNFFYLSANDRKRITWDVSKNEIKENPEKFSPNVLLRPVFQEVVLPNLAYIGGGAEIAYWLQLKALFLKEKIPFPMLVLRNSALILPEKAYSDFLGLGFSIPDLFQEVHLLEKEFVFRNAESSITLSVEKQALNQLYKRMAEKIKEEGLSRSVFALLQKHIREIEKLEEKWLRNEKKKNEIDIAKIRKIKERLFPDGVLQERHDNLIPYYLKHSSSFFEILKENLDPLELNFVVLYP